MLWIKAVVLGLLLSMPVQVPGRLQLGPTIEEQQDRLILVSDLTQGFQSETADLDCIVTYTESTQIITTFGPGGKRSVKMITTTEGAVEGQNCQNIPMPVTPGPKPSESSLSDLRY